MRNNLFALAREEDVQRGWTLSRQLIKVVMDEYSYISSEKDVTEEQIEDVLLAVQSLVDRGWITVPRRKG